MITIAAPHGARPGQRIQAALPDGRTIQVAMPAGLLPGQQFQVAVPPMVQQPQSAPPPQQQFAPPPQPQLAPPPQPQFAPPPQPQFAPPPQPQLAPPPQPLAPGPQTLVVRAPPGAMPGSMLQVATPDGRLVQVIVPVGVSPGQSFSASVPPAQPPPALAAAPAPIAAQPHQPAPKFDPMTGAPVPPPGEPARPPPLPMPAPAPAPPGAAKPPPPGVIRVILRVPTAAEPGQRIRADLPDGRVVEVAIPTGCAPGAEFTVHVAAFTSVSRQGVSERTHMNTPRTPAGTAHPNLAVVRPAKVSLIGMVDPEKDQAVRALDMLCKKQAFTDNAAQRVFDLIDADGDGYLTCDEFVGAIAEQEEVRDFIKMSGNKTLGSLLHAKSEAKIRKAFGRMDASKDGRISRDEWGSFVYEMARERVRVMRRQALLSQRCYWGLGLSDAPGAKKPLDPCGLATTLGLPRGYADDLWYYCKNNHPLLAIGLCDADHPVTRKERLVMESVVTTFCFFFAAMNAQQCHEDEETGCRVLWSLVMGGVGVEILYSYMLVLLGCPCLQRERSGHRCECCLDVCEAIGKCMMCPLLCVTLICFIAGLVVIINGSKVEAQPHYFIGWWLAARAWGYCVWILSALARQFNPLAARYPEGLFMKMKPKLTGIGKWSYQRELVLAKVAEKTESERQMLAVGADAAAEAGEPGAAEPGAAEPGAPAPPGEQTDLEEAMAAIAALELHTDEVDDDADAEMLLAIKSEAPGAQANSARDGAADAGDDTAPISPREVAPLLAIAEPDAPADGRPPLARVMSESAASIAAALAEDDAPEPAAAEVVADNGDAEPASMWATFYSYLGGEQGSEQGDAAALPVPPPLGDSSEA